MSDWSYVTLAYVVAWGGVTVYAVALARRVIAARRLEHRLRDMLAAETHDAAEDSKPSAASRTAATGWTAEGE